jgi:hypothetical protein
MGNCQCQLQATHFLDHNRNAHAIHRSGGALTGETTVHRGRNTTSEEAQREAKETKGLSARIIASQLEGNQGTTSI